MQINKIIILSTLVLLLSTVNKSISQNSSATDSLKYLLEESSGIEKASLLKEIGNNYLAEGYHQKAIPYYKKSLEIYCEYKDSLQQALVIRKIGAVYYHLSDFDKTLEYYLKSLKIYEHINDQNGILNTLNSIGNTYSRYYNNDKALEYYLRSYKMSEQTGNKKGLANVLNNIGTLYFYKKDYEKALEHYNKSLLLDIDNIDNNDSSSMSPPIQNIALVYYKMQRYDTAINYFHKALRLNEKYNNKRGVALVTNNLANLYVRTNNLAPAKHYLDRSLKISKEIDMKQIIRENYYLYTLFYTFKGDLDNMGKYSDLYDAITDTIFNEESSRLVAEMQTKYETEKKEQHIEMLNIENELKETQLQVRTYWLSIFIIAFALVVIFVIILAIQKRHLLFANKTLVQKNLEIVASEREILNANAKMSVVVDNDIKNLNDNNEKHPIKYESSLLTDEQKQDIKSTIINYMNTNRNYLNIDYTLSILADDLDIKRKYISQVINESFNQNFSNFLNRYRVKEARKILSSQDLNYTIEAIAGMVGYKSKTAFNNAFKKYVGVTPSFYLSSMKNESLKNKIQISHLAIQNI
ncbi:MAG: AraC family transcriptional regulator [Bacteroidales bacterium]|nr:AraC family transcriptional regulator [Bacteroidales bacterium]